MPEPTTPTTHALDYATLKKEQLLELLVQRDRDLADIAAERRRLDEIERQRADEADKKRAAKGPATLLGRIDVYDIDTPEDVLERAKAIRAGKIPAKAARLFKTDARLRAPKGSKLALRLGAKNGEIAVDVPIGTQFERGEVPDASIDAWYEAGAIVPIG